MLDVLRRRGITATFFALGRKIASPAHHALARPAHEDGHGVGNHTFSHDRPLGDCAGEAGHAEAEIGRAEAFLGTLRHPDRLFRPFGGGGRICPHLLSPEASAHLSAQAQTVVLVSAVHGDWHDPKGWPERAMRQCLAEQRPLLVLHDLPTGAMRHLDRFLGHLSDAGARFRQDFPDACVPMQRGRPTGALDAITAQPAARGDVPPEA